MLSMPWNKVEFAIVDFETTGQNSEKIGICEIGGVAVHSGRVDREFVYHTLINPEEPSTRGAYFVHKLDSRTLIKEKTFSQQADFFEMFIGERVLVAQLASTEMKCLRKANFKVPLMLDTCKLARRFRKLNSGNGLKDLVSEYNLRTAIDNDYDPNIGRGRRFHTAYYDALATAHLFVELLRRHHPAITLRELKRICEHT